MKLYDFALAPNPRRVRIFLAEKGVELEVVQVAIRDGAQFDSAFRAINPFLHTILITGFPSEDLLARLA